MTTRVYCTGSVAEWLATLHQRYRQRRRLKHDALYDAEYLITFLRLP